MTTSKREALDVLIAALCVVDAINEEPDSDPNIPTAAMPNPKDVRLVVLAHTLGLGDTTRSRHLEGDLIDVLDWVSEALKSLKLERSFKALEAALPLDTIEVEAYLEMASKLFDGKTDCS